MNNFNNFSIIGQNIMQLGQCTPTHWGLSNGIKSMASHGGLEDLNVTTKQAKQTKKPSFIDWCLTLP